MRRTQLDYKATVHDVTIYTHTAGCQQISRNRSVLYQACFIKDGRDRHILNSSHGYLRQIIRQLALLHTVARRTMRCGCSLFTMEARNQLFSQLDLDITRIGTRFAVSPQPVDLFHRAEAQQFEVAPHQRIRDRHQLAVHDARRLLNADIVAERLGHLLDAIQTFQQWHGQDALRLLPIGALKLTPHQQIEFLIGAAQFDVSLQGHGVITLHQRVKELMDGNGLVAFIALVEIIALKHSRNRVLRGQANEIGRAEFVHPRRVERHLGLGRIENFEDLRLVGFGVIENLLAGERRTRGAFAARVADHAGEVTDQEDDLMSQILKLAQLVYKDRVTQVQIRRCRVETSLDTQRLAALELFDQFSLDQEFICTALDQRQLFFNRLHFSPQFKGNQPYKIRAQLQVLPSVHPRISN
ncbi:Adenosylhomocysteinase [Pseudomonas syringae pv. delphinii]|nr:Adenosylhomocysteinase [Pseudomonas syringae pv. delphinii]